MHFSGGQVLIEIPLGLIISARMFSDPNVTLMSSLSSKAPTE